MSFQQSLNDSRSPLSLDANCRRFVNIIKKYKKGSRWGEERDFALLDQRISSWSLRHDATNPAAPRRLNRDLNLPVPSPQAKSVALVDGQNQTSCRRSRAQQGCDSGRVTDERPKADYPMVRGPGADCPKSASDRTEVRQFSHADIPKTIGAPILKAIFRKPSG